MTTPPRNEECANDKLRRRRKAEEYSEEGDNNTESTDPVNVSNNGGTDPQSDNNNNGGDRKHTQGPIQRRRGPASTWRYSSLMWRSLHVLAVIVYVFGWILRHDLHTSVECSMTYSQRQLIPLPLERPHPKYGLYKFVDERDPRPLHRQMVKSWLDVQRHHGGDDRKATEAYLNETTSSLKQSFFCQEKTTVSVLYIPGHWGSYMQSRSIGAHGIQLTGARDYEQSEKVVRALSQDLWQGNSEDEFEFDVYAVDFREEGAALHAQFLLAQTSFVAQSVLHIQENCPWTRIVLLGHSIGGYVARLTPKLYPETQYSVSNIITLGTPHGSPVFGWEPTIYKLHQQYLASFVDRSKEEIPVLVSISGGLRDEMIPPLACSASSIQNSVSILSPLIMDSGPADFTHPKLGMDHRAIVWCHNLLSKVRGVVFRLSKDEQKDPLATKRLNKIQKYFELDSYDYHEELRQQQTTFEKMYGFYKVIAMESAMLYHSEILVGLFAILGCLHCAGIDSLYPTVTRYFPMQLVIAVGLGTFTNFHIHRITILLMTLVANTILGVISWILSEGLPELFCNKKELLSRQLQRIQIPILGCFMLLLGLQCILKIGGWLSRPCISFIIATYVLAIFSVIAISSHKEVSHCHGKCIIHRQQKRQLAFVSMLVVICPFIVAGKIMMVLSGSDDIGQEIRGLTASYLPTRGLLKLTAQLFIPVTLQYFWIDISYANAALISQQVPAGNNSVGRKMLDVLEILRSIAMLLAIIGLGPSLVRMGQGYQAGTLLATISWLDFFLNPLGYQNHSLPPKNIQQCM